MGQKRERNTDRGALKEKPNESAARRWLPAGLLFGLAALTFLSYYRSLHGPLVLDDSIYIDPQRISDFWGRPFFRFRSVAELSFVMNRTGTWFP